MILVPRTFLYKGIFLKLWSKVSLIFLLFSLYFSSFNRKYLKLTKNGYNPVCDETLQLLMEHFVVISNSANFAPELVMEKHPFFILNPDYPNWFSVNILLAQCVSTCQLEYVHIYRLITQSVFIVNCCISGSKLLKKSFAIQVWLIISLLLSHFLYYNWYH